METIRRSGKLGAQLNSLEAAGFTAFVNGLVRSSYLTSLQVTGGDDPPRRVRGAKPKGGPSFPLRRPRGPALTAARRGS